MGLTREATAYAREIHAKWGPLYAAWPPEGPLRLGDYGTLDQHVFFPFDNIADRFGVKIRSRSSPDGIQRYYRSRGAVVVSTKAAGNAPGAQAALTVQFSRENAILFAAPDCRLEVMDNLGSVQQELVRLAAARQWKESHVIVTSILHAKKATILISSSRDSAIELSAKTAVGPIDLMDASLDLRIKSEKGISTRVVSQGGSTPLLQFHQYHDGFWSGPALGPVKLAPARARPAAQHKTLRRAARARKR